MQSLLPKIAASSSLLIVCMMLWAGSSYAGPSLEQAMRAYEAGDAETAYVLLKPHAEQGISEARLALGYLYYEGRGIEQDFALAAKWFTAAAKAGEPAAMYNLAWLHGTGEGLAANPAKRGYWLQRAAEAGYPLAQQEWAQQLLKSSDPAEQAQAVHWLAKARAAGMRPLAAAEAKPKASPPPLKSEPQQEVVETASEQPVEIAEEALVTTMPEPKPEPKPVVVPPQFRAETDGVISVSIANLRVAPSSDAKAKLRLLRGVEIITHESFSDWTRVTLVSQPEMSGWLKSDVYRLIK